MPSVSACTSEVSLFGQVHSESIYKSAQEACLHKYSESTCTHARQVSAHGHSDSVYKSAQWACLHNAVSLFAQVDSESI